MYRILVLSLIVSAAIASGACSGANVSLPVATAAPNPSLADEPEIRDALTAIEKMPDSPAGHTRLGAAYIKKARETGNFGINTEAENAVDRALTIAPNDVTARKLKASLQLTFHRFADGLEMGTQLQKELPDDSFALGVITDANAELGNYKQAVESAQRMVNLKPNSSSYARIAHLRSLHGDHSGAVELYKLAAKTADPLDKEAQSWCLSQLGDEYLRNGKYSDAEKAYDEALGILPEYTLALVGKGQVRVAANDLEAAAQYISKANEWAPFTHTVILLGDVYTRLGNVEKAAQQYELAEAGEEKLGGLHDAHRVALFWADRGVNLDAALEIAQADYNTQKDIYAADTLAWCLYKKGRFNEAKAAIDEAMRLKTNDAKLLYHAGMIEAALGNKMKARRRLAAAIKLNPSFDLIQSDIARNALKGLS